MKCPRRRIDPKTPCACRGVLSLPQKCIRYSLKSGCGTVIAIEISSHGHACGMDKITIGPRLGGRGFTFPELLPPRTGVKSFPDGNTARERDDRREYACDSSDRACAHYRFTFVPNG